MTSVGVIGAGGAAAGAVFEIDRQLAAAEITVFEQSSTLGGRGTARHRGPITYEPGTNYFKDSDERVVELVTETLATDGLVEITEPVWTFTSDEAVSEGRSLEERKWTYAGGLPQLATRLFAQTTATIHRQTAVQQLTRSDGQWHLTTGDRRHGPFEVVVVTPPAPETARLLETAAWEAPLRERLQAAIGAVSYRSVWTAVLGYERALEVPYYALVNVDKAHDIGWLSREECKPGHVPDGQSVLIVQSSDEWAKNHFDAPPEENVRTLAAGAASILDTEFLAEPAWSDHQGWRYALPEGGVASEPITAARADGLYFAGDWIPGEGRLPAAVRCGLDTGDAIAQANKP